MSKILHIVHNIIWGLLFLSLAVNAYFICTNIRNAGQAGSAGEGLEDELNNAANSFSSASGTVKDISTVNKQASGTVKQLSGTITDSTERCGDIEQTIGDLRKQIETLENDYNNSVNSGNCD